jgi:Cdc6-like AAA superfamily ATPase
VLQAQQQQQQQQHSPAPRRTEDVAAVAARKDEGFVERTEPVAEQQQLQLIDALQELKFLGEELPLRERELAAVRTAVTDAIAAGTGASVLVRGPAGSGKSTALISHFDSPVNKWCKQHDKPQPFSVSVFAFPKHPAGLYGRVLQALERKDISCIAADAQKQSEAVVFNTNHSSSSSSDLPMIVLKLYNIHIMAAYYTYELQQLQQLFKWVHTDGSRLILVTEGQIKLSQLMPGPQQHGIVPVQVVFDPFTESYLVAILEANGGSVVQPAALELCAKHACGNARWARELCLLAVQYADSDSTNSTRAVTLSHMQQTVRVTKLK